jgi:hypothetical protein
LPLSPGPIAQRVLCVAALPLLVFAIYDTVRIAAADSDFRANTPESVAHAVQLEPGNALYRELLAEHLEGDNRDPAADREAAARLSPLESKYWIGLGIHAEAAGDFGGAEKMYLHAAEIDRMFTPRWTLMNFYFRRQNADRFWIWTKRALEMGYDNQAAAYRLCWLMTEDPKQVESILPDNKLLKRNYLDFLLDTRRFQALSPVDREVAAAAEPADVPNLLYYCERTVPFNSRSAVTVWNELAAKKLIPFSALDPERGEVVTDGEFRVTPIERGFDWRVPAVDGVQITSADVHLTGEQPENAVLMLEFIPLTPGASYRMRFEYGSPTATASSGLTWVVADTFTDRVIAASGPLKLTGEDVTEEIEFNAGENQAARLELRYTREPGTVRHEEEVRLRKISVENTK